MNFLSWKNDSVSQYALGFKIKNLGLYEAEPHKARGPEPYARFINNTYMQKEPSNARRKSGLFPEFVDYTALPNPFNNC